MPPELPYPPASLRHRVGDLRGSTDELAAYDEVGRRCYECLVRSLPGEWRFSGSRVLDFGCGAGRTLRHLLAADTGAELWGCDVDRPSLEWLSAHASDRITLVQVGDEPRLPAPDRHFDLIYAFSVFTHLSQYWGGWMLELHRTLNEHGLLFATFLDPQSAPRLLGEAWNERDVGMIVLSEGAPWDEGGPFTVHSDWWLRAHCGRAFDVLALEPGVLEMGDGYRQGTMVLRKRPVSLTAEDLERPDPFDPRELNALWFSRKVAMRHAASVRAALEERIRGLGTDVEEKRAETERLAARCGELEREIARLAHELETVYTSKSWRWTKPLREVAERRRARQRS
jgi:SAM-dependent methyltransferase